MDIVITDSTVESKDVIVETHDVYKTFHVNNVINYGNDTSLYDRWIITIHTNCKSQIDNIFFVADTVYNDAFGHWVFETAIYLFELFHILKSIYPNIKLLLKQKRDYKILFCKLFDISESDIVYDLPSINKCIFPSPISMLNQQIEASANLKMQMLRFFNYFKTIDISSNTTNEFLLMPRQLKENYVNNDRVVPFEVLIREVPTLSNSVVVLHTDTIFDLKHQIKFCRTASNIILVDGSALGVNGLFSLNKKIYVLGTHTKSHCIDTNTFPKSRLVNHLITNVNGNTVMFFNTQHEIIDTIKHAVLK